VCLLVVARASRHVVCWRPLAAPRGRALLCMPILRVSIEGGHAPVVVLTDLLRPLLPPFSAPSKRRRRHSTSSSRFHAPGTILESTLDSTETRMLALHQAQQRRLTCTTRLSATTTNPPYENPFLRGRRGKAPMRRSQSLESLNVSDACRRTTCLARHAHVHVCARASVEAHAAPWPRAAHCAASWVRRAHACTRGRSLHAARHAPLRAGAPRTCGPACLRMLLWGRAVAACGHRH